MHRLLGPNGLFQSVYAVKYDSAADMVISIDEEQKTTLKKTIPFHAGLGILNVDLNSELHESRDLQGPCDEATEAYDGRDIFTIAPGLEIMLITNRDPPVDYV